MTAPLQDIIRLLAQYRDLLDRDAEVNAAALLRALIAEIENAPREGERPTG